MPYHPRGGGEKGRREVSTRSPVTTQPHRVIHESLDTSHDGEVKLAAPDVVVHALQESKHVLQSVLLYKPQHETAKRINPQSKITPHTG